MPVTIIRISKLAGEDERHWPRASSLFMPIPGIDQGACGFAPKNRLAKLVPLVESKLKSKGSKKTKKSR
jgi:hypothetical protein